MKIKIKGKEIELHYSMRIHILYENIMNQTLSNVSTNSTTGLVVLMYCAVLASMQKAKINTPLSYDDFMDWIDEQKPSVFADFAKWFKESVDVYAGLSKPEDEKKGKTGKKVEKIDPNA